MRDSADTAAAVVLSIQPISGLEVWVEPWNYPILYLSAEHVTQDMMGDSLISSPFLAWMNRFKPLERPEE
jgi:hypothetical protein